MLKAAGVDTESVAGYTEEEATTWEWRAVAEGRATVGLGISAARQPMVSVVPVGGERYDR